MSATGQEISRAQTALTAYQVARAGRVPLNSTDYRYKAKLEQAQAEGAPALSAFTGCMLVDDKRTRRDGYMQVGYQYRGNVEYFKEVIDRQYRQGPWLLRLPVQFGIVGAVLAACVATTVHASTVAQGAVFVVTFGLVVTLGIWATKQGLMMKFKRRPGLAPK